MKIAKDKLGHIAGGVAFGLATLPAPLWWAVLVVVVVAIGKEIYDHFFGGTVEAWDVMATCAGGGLVILVRVVFAVVGDVHL